MLPGLDQKRQDIGALLGQISDTQPWSAEANQKAARTRLVVLLCPENTPEVNRIRRRSRATSASPGSARTPRRSPLRRPARPAAGRAFRYDALTPFDQITDGLSQTLLIGETADSPGPWLRGGFSHRARVRRQTRCEAADRSWRAIRRVLPERGELRPVRRVGPHVHAANHAGCAVEDGNDCRGAGGPVVGE